VLLGRFRSRAHARIRLNHVAHSPEVFLRSTLLLVGLTYGGHAWAFAEDVCFEAGVGYRNCSELPEVCEPAGVDDARCRVAAAAAFVMEGSSVSAARSVVHADATQLIAQFMGFSADDAYWIAAYDEVADYGSFDVVDASGATLDGGAWATATLDGYVRTNLASGGMLVHFVSPFHLDHAEPISGIDGLAPDVEDGSTEVLLANLRTWAMGEAPGCTGGVTSPIDGDYARGQECFQQDGAVVPFEGDVRAIASADVHFATTTGLQVIASDGLEVPVTSDDLDTLVGAERAEDARLGLYLHALADRVSHHVCGDASYVYLDDQGFYADLTHDDCTQGAHALRHFWEWGVTAESLDPVHRTTGAALSVVTDELAVFAARRGVYVAERDTEPARAALLLGLEAALAEPEAVDRMAGVANLACSMGLEPFPGMPACPDEVDDTAPPDDEVEASGACGCGAGVPLGSAWILAMFALYRRRS
jgi:hypothetical protein